MALLSWSGLQARWYAPGAGGGRGSGVRRRAAWKAKQAGFWSSWSNRQQQLKHGGIVRLKQRITSVLTAAPFTSGVAHPEQPQEDNANVEQEVHDRLQRDDC